MSIQSIIRGGPLFQDLYDKEMDYVLKECNVLQLLPNEKIFSEGEIGEDLYLILSGKINIIKSGIIIATLNKADIFGELILLYEGTRSTDAVAIDHSDVLVLNYKSVLKMYDKNPRAMSIIMLNLSRLLAGRLKKSNFEVKELKQQINRMTNNEDKKS